MESTFVSCFLKEGFNQNFPSFRFSFVLSSDVLILYERFFIFYGYALPLCIITNSKTFLQKAMKLELNGCKWRECSGDKLWAINVRRWSFNDECHCRGGTKHYFVRYRAICVLQLFVNQVATSWILKLTLSF